VFFNNTFAAKLIVMDELHNRKYIASELKLMDILGEAISIVRRQNHAYDGLTIDSDIVLLINSILAGETVSQSRIDSVLIRNGWTISETYSVGCLNTCDPVREKSTSFYCDYIQKHFAGVIPIPRNEVILLVIRGGVYATQDDFLREFVPFMRDGDFRLGLSISSSAMQHIIYLARQAECALIHGTRTDPTCCYHNFTDYTLEYILQRGTSEMRPEMLCAEELLRLKKYDELNGSDYVTTLRYYLNNNLNAVATSKALFIHHATMVYRIKRLKEIGGIDFSNIDKLAHLVLSFNLIEMMYLKGPRDALDTGKRAVCLQS
jgi:hypothetical protein